MDDFGVLQTLLGSGGAVVIVGLVQLVKTTVTGLVPEEWQGRAVPLLSLVLAAGWNVIVANALSSLGQAVTFNGWVLAYLTIVAGLAANGLYSSGKTLAGR